MSETTTKWASQLRKKDVIVEAGKEYPPILKIESAMGGSWFNVWFTDDPNEKPSVWGQGERVKVRV